MPPEPPAVLPRVVGRVHPGVGRYDDLPRDPLPKGNLHAGDVDQYGTMERPPRRQRDGVSGVKADLQ